MKKECKTCQYGVITIIAECRHKDEKGNDSFKDQLCPPERICDNWTQADEHTLSINFYDWTKAEVIEVD